jgi:hypothetical protein
VNRKYPVWNTDAEKLIAFLFGIISHQVLRILKHLLLKSNLPTTA